ncbi:hypothetical protein [Thomasclavelia cocleata]|uniref:hypothetical protein n=1 Tax=Thomasclavelia cocleata TaxID=69824 RepID=UPI0012FD49BA|nr:hypothetical protein [Thomasclavelia cocleata]MCR1960092.1 hypothetical protein [Thomasclavelia cocleata]
MIFYEKLSYQKKIVYDKYYWVRYFALKIETFTKESDNKEINVLKEGKYSLKIFLNIEK